MDAYERGVDLVETYWGSLLSAIPAGTEMVDVHTHLGTDIDGMEGHLDDLLGIQEKTGIAQSFVFCLDEPDRHPAFRAANDRTLAFAERAGGRLVPFVRLDLNEEPIEEAVRCIDRGARGIKLHPRAQGFLTDDPRLEPVFALAAERKVPILIHGGRGLPPIADSLSRLVDRYEPTLIVAHAGIVDLAAMAAYFSGRPGVFFDTSVWSALDVLDLYRLVSPEQVLYASDYPYGRQPGSMLMVLRTAKLIGLSDDHLRATLGGSARRIADGAEPLPLSPPAGREGFTQPITLARIHQYLAMATTLFWTRQQDTIGVLGLALNACDERSNGHREETEQIRELLSTVRELWKTVPGVDDMDERMRVARTSFRLLHLATILSVTSAD